MRATIGEFLLVGLLLGCTNSFTEKGVDGGESGDSDGDSDSDGDGDSDSDGDGDSDSDGDGDSDSDGDGDTGATGDSDGDGDADGDSDGDGDDIPTGNTDTETSRTGDTDTELETESATDGEPERDTETHDESDTTVSSDTESSPSTDTGSNSGVDTDKPATIWIAGDSTVANGSTCPIGWGARFDALFNENITTVNSAVGGRSIRTWLYNVQSMMGADGECLIDTDAQGNPIYQDRWTQMLRDMASGDYLLIQFGINDGSATCDRHVGEDQYQLELGMMAEAAEERGTQPVFLTPVSMIRCSGPTAVGSRGFLDATFQAGEDYGVPVIDLHQLSVDLYNELGFCPLPNGANDVDATTGGEVGAFFCDDHTHFDDPGARAIAEVIADALVDQEIPLAAYLL